MSLTVVMKGPVANAGSILNLFIKRGINVPKIDAKMITAKSAVLTVIVKANESVKKKLYRKITEDKIIPLIDATPSSLSNFLPILSTPSES